MATLADELREAFGLGAMEARRLVAFVAERYPATWLVQVRCELCAEHKPLVEIHRRDWLPGVAPDMRLGTSDCDINPIRAPYLWVCTPCLPEYDRRFGARGT